MSPLHSPDGGAATHAPPRTGARPGAGGHMVGQARRAWGALAAHGWWTRGHLAAGLLVAAALVPPAWVAAGPPLCPFRLLTGLPCPGCGMTRSLVALAHGDPAGALYYHPLGPLVALALALLVLRELSQWAARRGLLGRRLPAPSREGGGQAPALLNGGGAWPLSGRPRGGERLAWAAVGLVLLVWLVRLPLWWLGQWVF